MAHKDIKIAKDVTSTYVSYYGYTYWKIDNQWYKKEEGEFIPVDDAMGLLLQFIVDITGD